MKNNFVGDEEILYRCVFCGKGNNYKIKENKLIFSSQAFNDRGQKPSLDRAKLCDNDPHYTQKAPENGVISLCCKDIRVIDLVQKDPKGNEKFKYKIDVVADPLEDNQAHAQIEPSPEYQTKSVFRKLKERLAWLATEKGEWEIPPDDLRNS